MTRVDIPLARYQIVAYDHPRKPGEGVMAYIQRLAELAAGAQPGEVGVKDVPRMPYREVE